MTSYSWLWLWLRSNGCARPQSDRRFSWVLSLVSLGTKKKILGGANFFFVCGCGIWLLADLAAISVELRGYLKPACGSVSLI